MSYLLFCSASHFYTIFFPFTSALWVIFALGMCPKGGGPKQSRNGKRISWNSPTYRVTSVGSAPLFLVVKLNHFQAWFLFFLLFFGGLACSSVRVPKQDLRLLSHSSLPRPSKKEGGNLCNVCLPAASPPLRICWRPFRNENTITKGDDIWIAFMFLFLLLRSALGRFQSQRKREESRLYTCVWVSSEFVNFKQSWLGGSKFNKRNWTGLFRCLS